MRATTRIYLVAWCDHVANSWMIGFTSKDLRTDFKRKMDAFHGRDIGWLNPEDIGSYVACLDGEHADEIDVYSEPIELDEHGFIWQPATWDPNRDQEEPCGDCGHPYHRHFDWMEDQAPVGCKYCMCFRFVAQVPVTQDSGQ